MSGDPKTLTSAQEGVLVALVEMELDAQNAGGLERGALGEFLLDFARRAVEAVGVPVVARDEASELRAAIREWVAADEALQGVTGPGVEVPVDAYRAAFGRATRAADALRRLAGGESGAS